MKPTLKGFFKYSQGLWIGWGLGTLISYGLLGVHFSIVGLILQIMFFSTLNWVYYKLYLRTLR